MESVRATEITPARTGRELYCPSCGRYLGVSSIPLNVQPGDAWAKLYCRGCRKFVQLDLSHPLRNGRESR